MYFDDTISHVQCVFGDQGDAKNWKKNYEAKMKAQANLIVYAPTSGEDEELDRYSNEKRTKEFATKFISAEIREFKIL
jgi:hypothetical protein